MFDAWPSPAAFPSSLVANPAQEAFEESYRDIAKALGWVFIDVGAVPSKEWKVSVSNNSHISVDLLIPLQLHSIKLDLGLGAVSSLPKPLHIEFFCFCEIVFRRVFYFVVKKPRLVIGVIVDTV
jgi:hypothetical protein